MQDHISDALITAFERQYDTDWDDPQLRNERLAMRYGWAAAMEAKPCLHQIQEPMSKPPASQRDELLQIALDFIGTLTGMSPPPIEVAPPEVFAPFYAFVDRVQAITAHQARDAGRWREVLMHVGAQWNIETPIFTLHPLKAPKDVMRGSVAQHFTEAVEASAAQRAALAAQGGEQ